MKFSRKEKDTAVIEPALDLAEIDDVIGRTANGSGSTPRHVATGPLGPSNASAASGNGNGHGARAPEGDEPAIGLIGNLLVERELVTEAQVKQARAIQEESGVDWARFSSTWAR